jgi:hypothetical protein
MNNVLEQDHRFIKKRIAASLWFRSVGGALNTIAQEDTRARSGRCARLGQWSARLVLTVTAWRACRIRP